MNIPRDAKTILDLQRTIGNQQVNRLLRPQPKVLAPQEVVPIQEFVTPQFVALQEVVPPQEESWLTRMFRLFHIPKFWSGGS
jgi:hypothetical protein